MLGSTVVQMSDSQGDGVKVDAFNGAGRRQEPFWPRGFNWNNLRYGTDEDTKHQHGSDSDPEESQQRQCQAQGIYINESQSQSTTQKFENSQPVPK